MFWQLAAIRYMSSHDTSCQQFCVLQCLDVKQPNGSSHIRWQGQWPPEGCTGISEGEHQRIGNAMSHLVAIHAAYQSGKGLAMVLEDDMAILQWPSHRLIYNAPPGWETLQLYSLSPALHLMLEEPPSLWLAWNPEFLSASAYIISRAGMRKVGPGGSEVCSAGRLRLCGLSCEECCFTTAGHAVQVLSRYAPASLNATAVTAVDFSGGPACNAEDLVFSSTHSYTCTDLFVYEEDGVSTIHNDETHAEIHRSARRHAELLWSQRGTLH